MNDTAGTTNETKPRNFASLRLMMSKHESTHRESSNKGGFHTTHWSVILGSQAQGAKGSEALETFCQHYWYPLYCYVRRRGSNPEDAQDITQGFFQHLLESNLLAKARREKGNFRSYLLASIKNYISNERVRATAQKRGGRQPQISFDESKEEKRYACEFAVESDPAQLYEKAWANSVIEQAVALLENDYADIGRSDVLDQLQVFLLGDKVSTSYAEKAAELGTSESAVKMLVYRLRRHFRECLRTVVAGTVSTSQEVDQELEHLVHILRGQ